jgi:hypothetical protein
MARDLLARNWKDLVENQVARALEGVRWMMFGLQNLWEEEE